MKQKIKRLFDIILSIILLILACPILLSVSVLVFLNLGRPIFYIQRRPGFNGELFNLLKFRTMIVEGDHRSDGDRLTAFGKKLRSSSLDELPELFNVLKGEMSLVGPRPLLEEYLPLYSEEQLRRHETKPGLTGLAQINGRNSLSWEEKFSYDLWYVDNYSIILDIKILILTLKSVFTKKGISAEGEATMPKFRGNKS